MNEYAFSVGVGAILAIIGILTLAGIGWAAALSGVALILLFVTIVLGGEENSK